MAESVIYSVISNRSFSESNSDEKIQVNNLKKYINDFGDFIHKTSRSRESKLSVKNDVLYECLPSLYKNTFKSEQIDKNYLFGSAVFENEQEIEKEIDNFMENPLEVQEGVFTCSRCKDTKTISFELQTRSADEAATVYVQCVGCKKRWKA